MIWLRWQDSNLRFLAYETKRMTTSIHREKLAVPRGNDPLLLAWQANVRPWTLWNHDLILSDFLPHVKWYPWSDSNWHYTPFERVASANWATRANSFGTGCWVWTNDLSLIKRLLYRWVNPVLVVISGIEPLSMPYEGSTHPSTSYHLLVEAVRFELTEPFDSLVFKTSAINRTLPHFLILVDTLLSLTHTNATSGDLWPAHAPL